MWRTVAAFALALFTNRETRADIREIAAKQIIERILGTGNVRRRKVSFREDL